MIFFLPQIRNALKIVDPEDDCRPFRNLHLIERLLYVTESLLSGLPADNFWAQHVAALEQLETREGKTNKLVEILRNVPQHETSEELQHTVTGRRFSDEIHATQDLLGKATLSSDDTNLIQKLEEDRRQVRTLFDIASRQSDRLFAQILGVLTETGQQVVGDDAVPVSRRHVSVPGVESRVRRGVDGIGSGRRHEHREEPSGSAQFTTHLLVEQVFRETG